MTAKYIFYIAIFLTVIGLLFSSWYFYNKSNNVKIESKVTQIHTRTPVVTTIIRENQPAEIDTVYIDNTQYEIARHKTRIDTTNVSVDLDISYDELLNVFSLKSNITSFIDSVYVEKEVIKTIKNKPKFAGLTCGIGSVIYKNEKGEIDTKAGQVDLGIKFVGKYSVSAFTNTNKDVGIRLGVDF